MGGVVDAVVDVGKAAVDTVVDAGEAVVDVGKKAIEVTVDAVEKTVDATKKIAEIIEDNVKLVVDAALAVPIILYDTIIKGESFTKSIANQLQEIGSDLGDVYNSLLDDTLGIDDGKFLGLEGGIFAKLGQLTKDFYHDHATQTVAIGVIVALIVASFFFPPAGEMAATISMAAFDIGLTSTITVLNTIYFLSYGAYLLGTSLLISGIIDGAVLAMYPSLLDNMFFFEQSQELLRVAALTAIMSGSIFDRFAGGVMYDSQYAGGVYYDAGTCANPTISVGGEFYLSPQAINLQFGYQDTTLKNLAGDENFTVIKPT